jgi:hypothetical protein
VDQEGEQRGVPAALGRVQQRGDLGGGEVGGLLGGDPGTADRRGRVGCERTVADGGVQDGAQDRVRRADRGLGEALAPKLDNPALDVRGADPVESEGGQRTGEDVGSGDAGVHDLGVPLAFGGLQRRVGPVHRERCERLPAVARREASLNPLADGGGLVPRLLGGVAVDGVPAGGT